MHLPGHTTTLQTRLEIGEHAAAGLNDPQIASVVGCSVWTVRKWRRRPGLGAGHPFNGTQDGCLLGRSATS